MSSISTVIRRKYTYIRRDELGRQIREERELVLRVNPDAMPPRRSKATRKRKLPSLSIGTRVFDIRSPDSIVGTLANRYETNGVEYGTVKAADGSGKMRRVRMEFLKRKPKRQSD